MWIDDVMIPCPLLHLGLYKDAQTPSRRHTSTHPMLQSFIISYPNWSSVPLDDSHLVEL
jgi:hypothetical protein